MLERFEEAARGAYRRRKASFPAEANHPDEEDLVCFMEGKSCMKEARQIMEHITKCDLCSERLSAQFKIEPHLSKDVPASLLKKIESMVSSEIQKENVFGIFLRLKEKVIEIIQTNGDVLVGQELVPAPLLRSRQISDFSEELSIIKDLKDLRILAKIDNRGGKVFSLAVNILNKRSQKNGRELRISLLKEGRELESYAADSGSSVFDNIPPGVYRIEISRGMCLAALLDMRVQI